MNKKQMLAALMKEAKEFAEKMDTKNADDVQKLADYKSRIEALKAEIEADEVKAALLKMVGSEPAPDSDADDADKDTGDPITDGLKKLDLAYLKKNRGSVQTFIKPAKAATDPVTAPVIPTYSQRIAVAPERVSVRSLFGSENISGNSYTYFVLGEVEGTPAVTAEGEKKPQIHPTYTPVTEALDKIPCFLKETDELLSDAPFLESVIRGRGIRTHKRAVEAYLINKLLGTSGLNTSVTGGISFDNILKAKTAVMDGSGFAPDALVINPVDLQALLLQKDNGTNGQYLMGGPAYAPYGNGVYSDTLPIWGLTVVASQNIAAGTAIVGAFKDGADVVTKVGEGLRVEVANTNEDDFVKNMITVRIEERILEAVRVPGAFAKLTNT